MNDAPALLGNKSIFPNRIPIARPTLPSAADVTSEFTDILESGILSKGSRRDAFEDAVADHLGVEHAVAVSSCTSGLMLTYQALGLAGADVVVPSFTFMATVSALRWVGARPVFADVNPRTTNLDLAAAEASITSQTKAIVAVHNFGNPARIDGLWKLARKFNLRLIFDAAHAFGSLFQGRPVGPQGDAQVFSLSPTKLVVAGEGGIVATDNSDIADHVRVGREFGNCGDYDSNFNGLNARFAEINAWLGLHSLRGLESAAERRNQLAAIYRDRLGRLPGINFQEVAQGDRCSYKDLSITVDANSYGLTRNELALALEAENIETRKYYDPPVHRQKAYRIYAPAEGSLPNTDFLSGAILNLPIWSHMEESTVSDVCVAIERAYHFRDAVHERLNEVCVRRESVSAS
ncbi:MAG: DegT/DnrJ/EryC1/StrS family aminotransferase [Pyrinomonadaceae bacterium]